MHGRIDNGHSSESSSLGTRCPSPSSTSHDACRAASCRLPPTGRTRAKRVPGSGAGSIRSFRSAIRAVTSRRSILKHTVPTSLPKLRADFSPAKLQIVHHEHIADEINDGHTIQINYTEGDTLTIGHTSYELIQFHFHSPSEHTVHGKHYPMEMHFVHKSPSGALAVVGVFIEQGAHNKAFDPIWENLPKQKGVESHFEHVHVDVDNLLPHKPTKLPIRRFLDHPALLGSGAVDRHEIAHPAF